MSLMATFTSTIHQQELVQGEAGYTNFPSCTLLFNTYQLCIQLTDSGLPKMKFHMCVPSREGINAALLAISLS